MRKNSTDVDKMEKQTVTCVLGKEEKCQPYNYDDAIDLAGNGWYNIGLIITLSLSLLAMCVDLFSFSVVVAMASCDLQLDLMQMSILVSMPFSGPVITAYAWGYFSDTRGRKLSLSIGMTVSFVMAVLCAFSPNWITMAVLKLVGTCFCSCAQSAAYALLGESCCGRVKNAYMLVMTSVVHQGLPVYMVTGFLVGKLDFAYDLDFISFVPWRMLILILATPLGLTAIFLVFFYESPKFLLNAGKEVEALRILEKIYRRNGGVGEYPVQKLVLNEGGNIKRKDESLLASLKQQTLPLFKPPLLCHTLILYYLIVIAYSVSGALYMWLPFLSEAFTSPSISNQSDALCNLIQLKSTINNAPMSCSSSPATVELPLMLAAVASGTFFSFVNVLMSRIASRRKASLIFIFFFASACCALVTLIPNRWSGIFYFGVFSTSLCMGPLFAYFVDLFPTSFRGMAACLGVMVARISSVAGINLVGPFITASCATTFYSLSAFLLSGVLVSFLLPKDKLKSNKR